MTRLLAFFNSPTRSKKALLHEDSQNQNIFMGFLDFLRPKAKQTEALVQQKVGRPECDITKTTIIAELLSIPKGERDDKWTKSFYENVKTASFACSNPQIFNGPDGFSYFILNTPEANKPFESFCIQNMKDDFLLDKGVGVAINPTHTSADWVFSYGDIVNLHINKELITKTDTIQPEKEFTIKKEEKVLLAQPSEIFLPQKVRQTIKFFLQSIGIKRPQVMMVCRKNDGQIIQELVFNIFREDYPSTEQLDRTLNQIAWFLPRHYAVLSLPKSSNLTSNFEDL